MKKMKSTTKSNQNRIKRKKKTSTNTSKIVKSKATTNSGDIVDLILHDHKPLKELILLLKDGEIAMSKKRPAYAEFEKLLSSHATAEEGSLYIHMENNDYFRANGLEGEAEHAIAEQLMMEISQIKNDGDHWMAKVKVLAELVDHHVKEEEQEMLKDIRKNVTLDTRIEIGKEYSQLLSELRDEGTQSNSFNQHPETQVGYA